MYAFKNTNRVSNFSFILGKCTIIMLKRLFIKTMVFIINVIIGIDCFVFIRGRLYNQSREFETLTKSEIQGFKVNLVRVEVSKSLKCQSFTAHT